MIRPSLLRIAPCAWELPRGLHCGEPPAAYDQAGERFLCSEHAAQAAREAEHDDGLAAIDEALRILRETRQA